MHDIIFRPIHYFRSQIKLNFTAHTGAAVGKKRMGRDEAPRGWSLRRAPSPEKNALLTVK